MLFEFTVTFQKQAFSGLLTPNQLHKTHQFVMVTLTPETVHRSKKSTPVKYLKPEAEKNNPKKSSVLAQFLGGKKI